MAQVVPSQQHRCTPIVETRFSATDNASRSIVDALTTALAEVRGVDVTELDPLYDTVDLEALSALFEGPARVQDSGATFRFPYRQWVVIVRGDGRIQVCEESRTGDDDEGQEAFTA